MYGAVLADGELEDRRGERLGKTEFVRDHLRGHELRGAAIGASAFHSASLAQSALEVAAPDARVSGALVAFDSVFACDDLEVGGGGGRVEPEFLSDHARGHLRLQL